VQLGVSAESPHRWIGCAVKHLGESRMQDCHRAPGERPE
jgi:hypothetical protein